jgi:hypothetical protein
MSYSKEADTTGQVLVAEGSTPQDNAGPAGNDTSTKEVTFATPSRQVTTRSSSTSTSSFAFRESSDPETTSGSRISSLYLGEPHSESSRTSQGSHPRQDAKVEDRDPEKTESSSPTGSGPVVAQLDGPVEEDPFAHEGEGEVQYKTMAWW